MRPNVKQSTATATASTQNTNTGINQSTSKIKPLSLSSKNWSCLKLSTSSHSEWIPLKKVLAVPTKASNGNSAISTFNPANSTINITGITNSNNIANNNINNKTNNRDNRNNNINHNNTNLTSTVVTSEENLTNLFDSHLLRVPILGSRQSGKTTLVRQFIDCVGMENPKPTFKHPTYYDPVITMNDRIYNVRLIDCPPVDGDYPTNSFDEWLKYRGWCLRNASAFIIVFDVNSERSFQYARNLRDQIVAERSDIPLILVANKVDLVHQQTNLPHPNPHQTLANSLTLSASGASNTAMLNGTQSSFRPNCRRDLAATVKKQWKGTVLVECSAKYNWHVMTVFKELMKILENREQTHRPIAARAVQNVLRRNQCTVM